MGRKPLDTAKPPSTEEHASGLGEGRDRGKAISADLRRAISPGKVPGRLMGTEQDGSDSVALVEWEQVADGALGSH